VPTRLAALQLQARQTPVLIADLLHSETRHASP
jgi:hypothetical protein